ncbi:hypothetical protein WKW50_24535 [Ochrobactrum sp. GPK 3]|uniref:hypothetical protein n=1 Tax=Brucella sp. 22210 TaxID=3453892 RepID=UPI00313854B8
MRKVIVDGAYLQFPLNFDDIVFVPPIPPYKVTGTGHATIKGHKVCHHGDEKKIIITNGYVTAAATIPGTVTITITHVDTADYVTSTRPVIIAQEWEALCTVTVMAKIPNPAGPIDEPHAPVKKNVPISINPNTFVEIEA